MKQKYPIIVLTLFLATFSFAQNTTSYQYNDEGWLLQSSNGITTTTYSYDAVGNRTNKTVVSNATLPDMVVLNESATPTTIDAGANTGVVCKVQNNGAVATTENSRVAYYLSANTIYDGSDVLLDFDTVGNLGVNGFEDKTKTLTIPAGTNTGTYYILFFVDDEFAIVESDEDNNIASVEVIVNGTPPTEDITVTNASITPSIVNAGGTINVTATQTYIGTQTVSELSPIQLRYYLSTDCVVSADDVYLGEDISNIGSDNTSEIESKNITIPTSINAGIYYILFSGDYSNIIINETDEDNIVCVQISITASNGLTYVPDDNFEAYLEANSMGNGIANDDYVATTNINSVTYLAVPLLNIQDLTGIEDFAALTELHCNSNQITSLDLTSNTNLTSLSCQQNQLTSLNIPANANLTVLECSRNQLTSLDVSVYTALAWLSCSGNPLTSLDVSTNINLMRLQCDLNQLTTLYLSNNTALEVLSCSRNSLTALDLSVNSALVTLWAHNNNLTSLNVKNGNNINFDVFRTTGNPNLTCIEVDNAAWSTANWTEIDPVASFSENCNHALTYVPDDNFEAYLEANSMGNGIANDDYVLTSNIETVTYLAVNGENISDLTGIQDFVALTELRCNSNQITSLDLTSNTNLTSLSCQQNLLTSLNIPVNANLTVLECFRNQLTSLDVSAYTALTLLSCSGNPITNLDVSTNLNLTRLQCNFNQLTTLDLSNNTALEVLSCAGNSLTALDLSVNSALVTLWTHNNNLTSLNVKNGNNINFDVFRTTGNPNLTCIEVDNAAWSTANWTEIDATSVFSENCRLTLDINIIGNGTVNPSPQPAGGTYNYGEIVILTATPDFGWQFDGWNDDLSGTTNPETITIDGDKTVTATFVCETASIPDPNFEQALIDLGYDDIIDGEVSKCNIENVTSLNVNDKGISDLTGIEHFIALENLHCRTNQLSVLSLNANVALIGLDCRWNQITSLDVNNNLNLTSLSCGSNLLNSLQINTNTVLTSLTCFGNQLTSLDTSNNPFLENVLCYDNLINNLDFSSNPNLTTLSCFNNQLTNINLIINSSLELFACYNNNLEVLDLTNNTSLSYVSCYDNQLTELDIRNGNNTNISSFSAEINSNLLCVYVDDAIWSQINWTYIDDNSSFVETEVECNALSVEESLLDQNILLYPNPAESLIYIEAKNITIKELRIYDIRGKKISSYNENPQSISLKNYANGVYLLRIEIEGGGIVIKRIIKK